MLTSVKRAIAILENAKLRSEQFLADENGTSADTWFTHAGIMDEALESALKELQKLCT